MNSSNEEKKETNKKKYMIPLICVGVLLAGGVTWSSMKRSEPPKKPAIIQTVSSTEESQPYHFEGESGESVTPKQKKAKKDNVPKNNVESVLEQYGLAPVIPLEITPSSSINSKEVAQMVNVIQKDNKEKEKEKPSQEIPVVPPVVTPEPPTTPEPPVDPVPEPVWVAPTINYSNNMLVVSIGSTFNARDYFSIQYGTDSQPTVTVSEIDTSSSSIQTLRITATDSRGYVAKAELQVVVNAAPTLQLLTEDLDLPLGKEVNLKDFVKATDLEEGDLTEAMQVNGQVDIETEGDYDIQYVVVDKYGFTSSLTLTLTVSNQAPVIKASDVTVEINQPFNPLEGVTAYDREDGEIVLTEANVLENNVNYEEEGVYTVSIGNVQDKHGKEAEIITYQVTVVNEAPTVENTVLELQEGDVFDAVAYRNQLVVHDREDDKMGKEVRLELSEDSLALVDTSKPGVYDITIKAIDSMGKETLVIGKVTVVAKAVIPEMPETPTPEEENDIDQPIIEGKEEIEAPVELDQIVSLPILQEKPSRDDEEIFSHLIEEGKLVE